jgi:hypothetical protein
MESITNEDMHESKFTLKPLTAELALSVGQNLRLDDRREVEQLSGYTAEAVCVESYYGSAYGSSIYIEAPNGKAAGVAGISPGNIIWLLCTDVSADYPHAFVREARRWVDNLPNPYLYNYVDMRNVAHVKLLKLLKFTFLRYFIYKGVPLIEFMKLCANQQQQP